MKRYFFDFRGIATNSYDYHGRFFRSAKDARDAAEMIALDLSCSEVEKWVGSKINVCDAIGTTLFSIPVLPLIECNAAA
jgi:hypothetical protein